MKRKLLLTGICLLVFTALACNLLTPQTQETATPSTQLPKPSETTPTQPTPTPLLTLILKLLGEEYRSQSAGIVFRNLTGYQITEESANNEPVLWIKQPGGDPKTGPVISVQIYSSPSGLTNEQILDQFTAKSTNLKLSKTIGIMLGELPALSSDVTGNENGVNIRGKILAVVTTDKRSFCIYGFATDEKWVDFEPLMDALTSSVAFFKPEAVLTPATKIGSTNPPTFTAAAPTFQIPTRVVNTPPAGITVPPKPNTPTAGVTLPVLPAEKSATPGLKTPLLPPTPTSVHSTIQAPPTPTHTSPN